jgi:heat shock protein HtpX
MQNIYEAQSANKRKSLLVVILFAGFIALSVYVISSAMSIYMGYEAGGLGIAGMAMILSGLMSLGSYYYSDKIVLAISGARPADRKKDFNFYTTAENLALTAGLPRPKLYVIEDSAPNAFATGRDPDHAVICATTGLLDKLNRSQLEGVIAHELTHIKNYDIRLMSLVTVMVGIIALLGDWLLRMSFHSRGSDDNKKSGAAVILVIGFVFAILSPLIAQLIQLAISRRREFMADTGAVAITRQPSALIEALQIISSDHEPLEVANKATAHLYIANPFKDKAHGAVNWFSGLFNTHPPIQDRITSLKQMS